MTIAPARKKELTAEYRRHDGDSGSPEIQVAILTDRIAELTEHLKIQKKDHAARRGLTLMVGKRNRLLKYLHGADSAGYHGLIKKLGLRK